mmetsp:Transcript_7958/g.26416  ORF Transcript_7958/g.26416 Transcript_7958/m.26416 type:complete len:255 (+) Transcript_7958:481-1245(+)
MPRVFKFSGTSTGSFVGPSMYQGTCFFKGFVVCFAMRFAEGCSVAKRFAVSGRRASAKSCVVATSSPTSAHATSTATTFGGTFFGGWFASAAVPHPGHAPVAATARAFMAKEAPSRYPPPARWHRYSSFKSSSDGAGAGISTVISSAAPPVTGGTGGVYTPAYRPTKPPRGMWRVENKPAPAPGIWLVRTVVGGAPRSAMLFFSALTALFLPVFVFAMVGSRNVSAASAAAAARYSAWRASLGGMPRSTDTTWS